ncbi:MBL fold metallo-hydrolase [Elongatibacter sediminis]|uniref:MBL fold metallo-hydrolase n=1 Tax=Elongatibacter sediminis TaxID=3119006 RepID=A0AAW9RFX6_9GAMM
MNVGNSHETTRIDEIADGIYRISSRIPPSVIPNGFTFNQFLIDDEEPLLFHTGGRRLFDATADAIGRVVPVDRLRWIAYSHFEPDECGAMNQFLAAAPRAQPLCGRIGAMVCMPDYADRGARALADGETLELGRHTVEWIDAPHVPHGWDCGLMAETQTRTLFCGDLFTQFGDRHEPLTEGDILGPSEDARKALDYFAHGPASPAVIERLAGGDPKTLACMHGTSFQGDGAALLRALGSALQPSQKVSEN